MRDLYIKPQECLLKPTFNVPDSYERRPMSAKGRSFMVRCNNYQQSRPNIKKQFNLYIINISRKDSNSFGRIGHCNKFIDSKRPSTSSM